MNLNFNWSFTSFFFSGFSLTYDSECIDCRDNGNGDAVVWLAGQKPFPDKCKNSPWQLPSLSCLALKYHRTVDFPQFMTIFPSQIHFHFHCAVLSSAVNTTPLILHQIFMNFHSQNDKKNFNVKEWLYIWWLSSLLLLFNVSTQ